MKKGLFYRVLLGGVAALAFAPAQGQTVPTTAENNGAALEDIVVTAQRREQRFDDVGIAVNVIGSAELKSAGVQSFTDLAGQTPNVQIKGVMAGNVTNVAIRGIGLNDYAVNNNPAAGIYVDNVYLVSPAMLSFGMFDVDRVEVLKGPQGDLYGRNTTAGAVNVISRKPTDTPDVQLSTGYGNYQNWHLDGAVGGPLTSNLTARFALQTVQQGSGWQTNYVTGKKVGKIDRTSGRLQLNWKPTDDLSILLSGHLGYDRSDTALYKAENTFTNEGAPFADQPRVSGASIPPKTDISSAGGSVTVNWTLNPALTLTSISAYEHFSRFQTEDGDGTSLRQLDDIFRNKVDQFSQETRLSYHSDNLELIGGAFYSHDKVTTRDEFFAPDLLPVLGIPSETLGSQFRQRTNAYAAFAHAEWTFASRITLVGGLRYTKERKTFDRATTFLCTGTVCNDLFAPVDNRYSTSNLSGKIGINYKVADRTLVYGSISRGFKSGGFQGQLTFDPSTLTPFRDEKLTSYEIGVKTRLLPNLQVNVSAFNYEYRDAQIYGPLYDSPVGVLFGIGTAGNARVQGLEADVSWRPAAGLDIRGGVGFIDTKITKSIVAGVAEGSRLPNAPKLTLNGQVRYETQLADGLGADMTLSGSYQSQVAFDIVRNPQQAIEGGYVLANAEAGVSPGDRWRISVWAKNLFDKTYRTQAFFTTIGWTYFYGPPRTYGLNVSYKL